MDGAMDELDRVMDLCAARGLRVLLDLHALRKSQNGLDNSGQTAQVQWWVGADGAAHYRHWDIRGGDWIGRFNTSTQQV
jgi:aryl-phospho-beta-D-glucosidase BglC (GH1 family)